MNRLDHHLDAELLELDLQQHISIPWKLIRKMKFR
jgi:hypothetical protein